MATDPAAPPEPPLDAKAKGILLDMWPATGVGGTTVHSLWPAAGDGRWLRCRPKPPTATGTFPLIVRAGKKSRIDPDGLYAGWGTDGNDQLFVDLIIFETCKSRQNVEEKQGKYASHVGALALEIPRAWLSDKVTPDGGSRKAAAGLTAHEFHADPIRFPVRHATVVFVLPPDVYEWARGQPLNAHEMAMTVNSLASYNAEPFRSWFLHAFHDGRFYTST
jgi:hypothetical protein